jgi:hypothetical protein
MSLLEISALAFTIHGTSNTIAKNILASNLFIFLPPDIFYFTLLSCQASIDE